MYESIKNELDKIHIEYKENVSLKDITWIRRGGIASLFCQPRNTFELMELCKFLRKNRINFDLIGGSSNLYCKESYNPHILISTLKVNKYYIDSEYIECDCGVQSSILAMKCCEKGYKGFEGLVNLPGTVGGAICNNSGAFGCCMSDNLKSVVFVDEYGEERELYKEDFDFKHRSSAIKEKRLIGTIISCRFIKKVVSENLVQIAEQNKSTRKETQHGPLLNLGSIFAGNKIRRLNRKDFGSFILYIRYLIFMTWYKFYGCHVGKYKYAIKNFLFNILGYTEISKYVSDRNINCFVWLDKGADNAFEKYTEFMKKFNISSKFEIEIRE